MRHHLFQLGGRLLVVVLQLLEADALQFGRGLFGGEGVDQDLDVFGRPGNQLGEQRCVVWGKKQGYCNDSF